MRDCWCGNSEYLPFSNEYGSCSACGTLVSLAGMSTEELQVSNDETDFYGKRYWLDHQNEDLGFPDIFKRARNDLTERNLHWLKALLKYRLPPCKVLELGCTHGSFVALLRQAGYDAAGVEMSPWVVEFAQKTFGVPVSVGPIETLQIAPGSLDVIALMDVLEHLPDPVATMAHCLELLKPDGILIIQTPQFKEGMNYNSLIETNGPFLNQLKADEHLYLFTERSVARLFQNLGAENIQFEPAIFGHYDMFFAVSRAQLQASTPEQVDCILLDKPDGRLVLALLDIYSRETSALAQSQADKLHLATQLQASEADRAARLTVIEAQGVELGRIPQLEADIVHLATQLLASEADRATHLAVIEAQGVELGRIPQLEADIVHLTTQLQASEAVRSALNENKWIRLGINLGLVSTKNS